MRYNYIGFVTSEVEYTIDQNATAFWDWMMQVLYNPILALVKSSVLVFMLRLGGHKTEVRWTIYILNTLNTLQGAAIFFVVVFQQVPVYAVWTPSITPTMRIDKVKMFIATAVLTIVTDVLVLVIPVYLFIGLRMRVATKLGLITVFLLGGV